MVRLGEPVDRRMLEGGGGGRHVKADCSVVPSGGVRQVTGGGSECSWTEEFFFQRYSMTHSSWHDSSLK